MSKKWLQKLSERMKKYSMFISVKVRFCESAALVWWSFCSIFEYRWKTINYKEIFANSYDESYPLWIWEICRLLIFESVLLTNHPTWKYHLTHIHHVIWGICQLLYPHLTKSKINRMRMDEDEILTCRSELSMVNHSV